MSGIRSGSLVVKAASIIEKDDQADGLHSIDSKSGVFTKDIVKM